MEHAPESLPGPLIPPFDLPFPEGQPGSFHSRLGYCHRIPANIRHFPGKGPQDKTVSLLGLIDEFLVHLPQSDSFLRPNGIQSLVRNGSSCGDRQHAAVTVPFHPSMDPVIENPGACRDVSLMLIIPSQHPQYRLHIFPGQIPERPCPGQNLHHLFHLITLESCHGHQVLGQHIQAFLRRVQMLHPALPGQLGRHATGHTFCRRPGKQIHHTDPAGIVSGPAQPLHGTRNGAGTAHLQYLVNLPHIDSQFHGGSGTQQPEPPFPQGHLCLRPLLLGKASMMNPGKILPTQEIHIISQLLRIPPSLYKGNDTAAALAVPEHQAAQFLPHRILPVFFGGIHIRTEYLQAHLLLHGGGSDPHLLRCQVPGCLVQGFYGGRQSDPLQVPSAELVQTGQGQHQMGTPLGIYDGMQFIQDHCPGSGQHILSRLAGQHQV